MLHKLPKCDTEETWNEQMLLGKMTLIDLLNTRLATKLQFVKSWISAKCNKAKCSKTRYGGVYSNSSPLNWWCHPTISSSVIPFYSRLWSFPASGSFPMSQLFASGGQSIGVSASASVLPMNIQDWFPLGWTGWRSLHSKGLSRVFSNTTVQKHQFLSTQLSL